ncbi:GAF and ANTAR domain-containing protein [Arthrobacter agilis]|uniref:GAF and ANTAR domain-containing protein n=1 Tax=Arthrobacter agilis TaxID=37921 RepID=UPI002365B5D8|nr:GAF and ANTAR domain-containing protein [Arthrobacter agilis]WDF33073.1 GAF and ANTAR domain-containing protein [Arthrobacter agilis]
MTNDHVETAVRDRSIPAETLSLLQNMVLDSADVGKFLSGLSSLAARALSTPEREVLCGMTLLLPKKNGTVASSSDVVRQLDELQYAYGDGPCLTAARTQTPMCVDDSSSDHRWSDYFAAISAHGVQSILAIPIPLDGQAACALNLYATAPRSFGSDSIKLAHQFAREASQSLRLAVRIAHLTETGQNLTTAMHSRTTIDLAAGIIMAQNKCSQEQAMMILKAASSGRNTKLRDVATAIVTSITPATPATHFDE